MKYSLDLDPVTEQITPLCIPSASDHAEVEIGAEEKNGFKCSDSPLSFIDATISLKNLRQCSLDARTSDIVPIIVGACLAGLVIAVLIAYLVGRARAK
uniref:Lysosome-associated membrane glycoprotein 2-like transmembrane domain-containing protein n=1 Tax=Parascaris equorum TaxID=6256 RepID=A0A914RNQ2_PAREQ